MFNLKNNMNFITWLIRKLENIRTKLADREAIKNLSKLQKKSHRKVNKINLGCNEAEQVYG